MQKVCKKNFQCIGGGRNLVKFQSKILKNSNDIFEEKVGTGMVLVLSAMKVSVVT